VVDVRGYDAASSVRAAEPIGARLAELPCPTIARISGPEAAGATPSAAGVVDAFDVVVSSDEALGEVLTAIERTPLAAMALVQLLRHSARLTIHDALIAESLVYSTLQAGPEFGAWLSSRSGRPAPAAAGGPAVVVERDGACMNLTLNRPETHNAFSAEMRDALVEALRVVVSDASVERVVVRGRGTSFCSGGYLDEFGSLPDPTTAHAVRSTRNAGRLLAACADRVRVNVHGACIGAGIELPAFAGRVVASPDAYFVLPEVAMGLVPGAGGTASIARRIGRQRTAAMALTGARVDARTALAWGLIDEIAA